MWLKSGHVHGVSSFQWEQLQVKVCRFFGWGVWFGAKLTHNEHICKISSKCEKVLNVMRCLTGSGGRASRSAIKKN